MVFIYMSALCKNKSGIVFLCVKDRSNSYLMLYDSSIMDPDHLLKVTFSNSCMILCFFTYTGTLHDAKLGGR